MRIFKSLIKVIGVLAFIAVLDFALIFALVPYSSNANLTWEEYRQQENIDLAFIGNSRAAQAFNAQQIGDELGVDAFNLSTQDQRIEESYLALKKVVDEYHPDTIVFGFDPSDLQGEKFTNPGRAFIQAKDQGDFGAFISDCLYCFTNERFYTTTDSINWLFPWVDNHVKLSPSTILENIKLKIAHPSQKEAAKTSLGNYTYYGKGYSNVSITLDYNEGKSQVFTDFYEEEELDDQKLQTLVDMADYCEQNNVNFVMIAVPMPVFSVLSFGDLYSDYSVVAQTLAREHGAEYYDLNLAKPELYDTTVATNYVDFQHLNAQGAVAASEGVTKLLQACAAGEDTSGLFYTQSEYAAAHQYVDLVTLEATPTDGSVKLEATAYAGKGTPLEYQFCVKDDAGSWRVVRDWSEDALFDLPVEGHGTYTVRVNARKVGSTAEYDHYRELLVTY